MLTRFVCAFTSVMFCAAASAAPATMPDWGAVGQALGKTGTEMPGDIYRIGLPRSDLHVTLDGVSIKPALALGSWLAFKAMDGKVVVMGDLVLTEDEISPVMQKLAEEHIAITALHNHLLRARPPTFYMHVMAEGDAVTVAKSLHDALVLSHTPLGASPVPSVAGIDLDTAAIDKALDVKGKPAGGVYQVGIPRSAPVIEHGITVPASMGAAEAINIQPTGDGKVAATGDFVLTASEVNPVLQSLRQNEIEVTALHNHMLDEQPRLFFMHFWVHDDLNKVLIGLRAALTHVAVQHGGERS
jgi:hypothetical protein